MACEIDYSLIEDLATDCSQPIGGLKTIKYRKFKSTQDPFVEIIFNEKDKITNYSEVLTNNDNGTTVVDQTLTAFLAGINEDNHDTLNALCNPNVRLEVQIEFINGTSIIMGENYGVSLTEVTVNSGANAGDNYGYTIIFKGEEPAHSSLIK